MRSDRRSRLRLLCQFVSHNSFTQRQSVERRFESGWTNSISSANWATVIRFWCNNVCQCVCLSNMVEITGALQAHNFSLNSSTGSASYRWFADVPLDDRLKSLGNQEDLENLVNQTHTKHKAIIESHADFCQFFLAKNDALAGWTIWRIKMRISRGIDGKNEEFVFAPLRIRSSQMKTRIQ